MTHTVIESATPMEGGSENGKYAYDDELKKFNWSLLALQGILFGIGIFNLMSATAVEDKALGFIRLSSSGLPWAWDSRYSFY
jgi:hypothetical protein